MLFHTWEFLIFFIVAYSGYLMLKKTKYMNLWLLIASYFFYGWWNPLFLILIFYSTALDYFVGLKLGQEKRRKMWLAFSIINNLFLLGFFKYSGFFTENLNLLFNFLHLGITIPEPDIILPVGISFFTFQSMSYSIDVYRRQLKVEKSFIKFAAFVSLFPQLVAGPIERASNLLPQLDKEPRIRSIDVTDGISLFLVGLFKKLAMADFLAIYVNKIYGMPDQYGSLALLLATYAFAWQIYFDFSGYTDMARGVGKMMGIKFMLNFNNPYTAVSLRDFWRRWHISLSSWFKDYVYIPLGGNRKGTFAMYKNMMLTMIISGFWHGAAWTFIIWGTLHAVGQAVTHKLESTTFYKEKIPKIVKQFFIFHFVLFTWIFFRAESLNDALLIIKRIFSGISGEVNAPVIMFGLVALIWLYQLFFNSKYKNILEKSYVKVGLALAMLIYIIIFATAGHNQFIYFQF